MLSALAIVIGAHSGVPDVLVDRDDVAITESCRVVVPPGLVIADDNGDGVIHVMADGVMLEFADGSELRGAPAGTPWDALRGTGVRVSGHAGVTLRNLRVHGYKTAVRADAADDLTVDAADLSDNYRQRLRSTPLAEDNADWLFPHDNDAHQWVTRHGAALCVERSARVSISGVRVRRGQNGIVLDRVSGSKVFDNDCSFLSGWGLAMWRSSGNLVSRNALDFCVRGYSHGVYNRGQDSAGVLFFEQCRDNVFVENSATHGGDGFFGFAGREAIGEAPAPAPGFDYTAGCTGNLLLDNDFSYAVAHGIELTFSHGNRLVGNRLVECGICGVWGGYSTGTLIAHNTIERNGQMAYGLERGGVNIEHGSRNFIVENRFRENACAVHLWWDDDGALLSRPGVVASGSDVVGNVIARNRFDGDAIALHLRDTGAGHLRDTIYVANEAVNVPTEIDAPPDALPLTRGDAPGLGRPQADAIGSSRPVGARAALAGRQNIVMDEWGPWDHESVSVRLRGVEAGVATFEVYGVGAWDGPSSASGVLRFESSERGRSYSLEVETSPAARIDVRPGSPVVLALTGPGGVWSYRVRARLADEPARSWDGTVVSAPWDLVAFPWDDASDPRRAPDAWRALAGSPGAVRSTLPALDLRFGAKGPRDMRWSADMTSRGPGRDHFGIIARASIAFPAGRWRAVVTSDDGVRVRVNGQTAVENWTWHGPTTDAGVFTSDGSESAVEVEYFEIDGHAVLSVAFEPASEQGR